MRVLKVLFAGLFVVVAVVSGFVVAAVAAVVALTLLLVRRLVRPARGGAGGRGPTPAHDRRPPNPLAGDAIDVAATELPPDPPSGRPAA